MKYSFSLIFVAIFFIGNSMAQTSGESSEVVRQAIEENFQQMGQAMATGDAQELALHFTEDALLKFPGADPLKGRKAIQEAHQQLIDQGIDIRPKTQEVEAAGNMAYEIGTYELINRQGQTIDQGHYATLWKKEDEWKIARDIISSTKSNSAANDEMANRTAIESTLDLYFRGLIDKNMDILPLAKDVLFVGPTGYTIQGTEDVVPFLANTAGMVTDVRVIKTVIEGDYACKITDYDWTNGETTPLAICFRVEGHKITEIRPYFDPRPILD